MRLTRIWGILGLVACSAVAAPWSAMAQESGWYGGLNLGRSKSTIDDARITGNLLGSGFTTRSIVDDDRDTGYKIYGGYTVNRNFALEGGYFNLGKFGFTAATTPPGTLNGNIKLQGLFLDAVGILPLTEKFSVFGRVGVDYAQARDSFSSSGFVGVANPSPSKNAANYKFGAGVQYDFNPSLGVRAEAERYRIYDAVGNKGDIDLLSVGLVWRFGAKAPARIARAAVPEPVIVAAAPPPPVVLTPPPPPVVVPPVAPPAPRPAPVKVTFSADSLFDFDKAIVKPEGRQRLDRFAADLKGSSFDIIIVTGHTDRIGSQAYNTALSVRRANAVKAYLVESAEIPAVKIDAKGMGASTPVTHPGECKGTTKTVKLVACLQPDRRVEVEVSGTRQ